MRHGNTYELPSGTPVRLSHLTEQEQWLLDNAKRPGSCSRPPVSTGSQLNCTQHNDLLPHLTYRDHQYKEHSLPVYAESAFAAVASLKQLGYDITKVTHSFPSK